MRIGAVDQAAVVSRLVDSGPKVCLASEQTLTNRVVVMLKLCTGLPIPAWGTVGCDSVWHWSCSCALPCMGFMTCFIHVLHLEFELGR